jgi:hypothetical protein
MKKRPLAVTILSWLLIVVGLVGLVYHAQELDLRQPFQNDTVWVELVRVLAMAWIAFHVVISIFHSWSQVAMHALILLVFAFFLFRPAANRYFGSDA